MRFLHDVVYLSKLHQCSMWSWRSLGVFACPFSWLLYIATDQHLPDFFSRWVHAREVKLRCASGPKWSMASLFKKKTEGDIESFKLTWGSEFFAGSKAWRMYRYRSVFEGVWCTGQKINDFFTLQNNSFSLGLNFHFLVRAYSYATLQENDWNLPVSPSSLEYHNYFARG